MTAPDSAPALGSTGAVPSSNELGDAFAAEIRRLHPKGDATPDEAAKIAVSVLASRSDIEFVKLESPRFLTYKWKGVAHPNHFMFEAPPSTTPLSLADAHRQAIELLESVARPGGLMAFGYGYELYGPNTQTARTLALIARPDLAAVAQTRPEELRGTALVDRTFLQDVLEKRSR